MNLAPEAWTLLGIIITAIGGLIGVVMTAWTQRGQTRLAEVKELRSEVRQLREDLSKAHKEMIEARTEAYSIRDAARLHLSMSAAYIYQLQAHINTEQPPPAPEPPAELTHLLSDSSKPPQ